MSLRNFLLLFQIPTSAGRSLILILLLLMAGADAFAQSRSELERQRKQKQDEIAFTRKLIAQTSSEQKQTASHLALLNRQISTREELIKTIQSELSLLNNQIDENTAIVMALEKDLEDLRTEYAKMVNFMYRNRSAYDEIVFIFSAPGFNEAWQRLKLMRYFSDFRRNQVAMIERTQVMILSRVHDLEEKKEEKQELLAQQENERQELVADQSSKTKLVQELSNKEQELRRQLRENERIAANLNRAIEEVIRKEMEAARRKAEESSDKPATSSGFALTPEALKLSAEFAQNQRNLPWPVEKGFISETFGSHAHPTLRGVTTVNNGVNIRTERGSKARAVFSGEVQPIVRIPGSNYAVIIMHGEYFSVYSNLDEVYVKPGDKVNPRDPIGLIGHNGRTGVTELHFEIWKQFDKLNPQLWLTR